MSLDRNGVQGGFSRGDIREGYRRAWNTDLREIILSKVFENQTEFKGHR